MELRKSPLLIAISCSADHRTLEEVAAGSFIYSALLLIEGVGLCKRPEGETSAEFYAKLRRWLDRDMPKAKSPLHAPRQVDDDPAE